MGLRCPLRRRRVQRNAPGECLSRVRKILANVLHGGEGPGRRWARVSPEGDGVVSVQVPAIEVLYHALALESPGVVETDLVSLENSGIIFLVAAGRRCIHCQPPTAGGLSAVGGRSWWQRAVGRLT